MDTATDRATRPYIRRLDLVTDDVKADILAEKLTNVEIGEKYGIPKYTISAERKKLGAGSMKYKSRRKIPAEEEALLGTMPDADLAERWEVTRQAVWVRRNRLGIGAYLKDEPL